MIRRPPVSTRTDTRFPDTTRFLSQRRLSSLDPIERNRRNIERGDRAALALQFGYDRAADVAAGSRYDHAHLANSSCEVVATGRIADSPWGYPSNLSCIGHPLFYQNRNFILPVCAIFARLRVPSVRSSGASSPGRQPILRRARACKQY